MSDTIESLIADILISAGPDRPRLAERADTLWKIERAEKATLQEELLKKDAIIRLKDREIAEEKRMNAKLRKMKFGSNADRNPAKGNGLEKPEDENGSQNQPNPPDGQHEEDNPRQSDRPKTNPPKQVNRSGRGRRIWPDHLERRVIYMGESDQKCSCRCGGALLGYDNNETLEVDPAKFYVLVKKHPKCRCIKEGKIKSTPFLPRLFPHSCATNTLLAHTITLRYGWQMPLYRQQGMLRSQGIDLNRSTLTNWLNRVAVEALFSVFELMEAELKRSGARLFMDETTLPQLHPGNGKTRTSYLYALLRDDRSFGGKDPPIVLYYHRPTRAMHEIHGILHNVEAPIQTDAYPGYGQVGNKGTSSEGSTRVKCWAHARRNFTDEYEFNQTQDAGIIIEMIAELYRIEKEVRGQHPHIRKEHRRKFSVPLLDRLKSFLAKCSDRHLKKNKMGKAIQYVLKLWDDLVRFVDDGRIDLDTNAVDVRRQSFWFQRLRNLSEYPAHLVDFIMRRVCCVASAGSRVFCV